MSPPLLRADAVALRRGGRAILDDIDLAVEPGQILTLIGPNGAGKTTLVRVLLGLLEPDAGRVIRRPRLHIGYMPQRLELSPHLPLDVRRFLKLSGVNDGGRIEAALAEVGVPGIGGRTMEVLSGGEARRVLMARALLRDPELLVLDEPAQAVDVNGQREMYELITRLRRQRGCAVLLVSHDLHLVMAATDRVMCLNGHVCCEGHPEAVSHHPAYQELFGAALGNAFAVYAHAHDHRHGLAQAGTAEED